MTRPNPGSHWLRRIAGAIVVASAAFALLSFWNTWELSMLIRVAAAIVLGLLFLTFGGSVWRWIDEIYMWS